MPRSRAGKWLSTLHTLWQSHCSFLFLGWPERSGAYAVLAHEAIIDSSWDTDIRPLLLKRFPEAAQGKSSKKPTATRTVVAIIQDMGYYPHGSKFFSDLTHYVRSGDFILALLRDSQDLNSYAFALGALSHYAADNDGHLIAVNQAVPLLYPDLKKKYGDVVTYEENPLAHVKTEFGFDVLEGSQRPLRTRQLPRLYRFRCFRASTGTSLSRNLRLGSQERSL